MVRIRGVEPLDSFRVRLTLTDGQIVERDLEPLLAGPIFEPLVRDRGAFRKMKVVEGTLAWPGNLDLDPDMIIWGGPPPAEERKEAS